jgi:hypothetical protein
VYDRVHSRRSTDFLDSYDPVSIRIFDASFHVWLRVFEESLVCWRRATGSLCASLRFFQRHCHMVQLFGQHLWRRFCDPDYSLLGQLV